MNFGLRPEEYDESLLLPAKDFLMSYLQLEFVDVTELDEHELQHAHVLSAIKTRFD